MRDPRFYFGFGCGADMNGFGAQGGPRGAATVTYPFKSFDGKLTIDKQGSGQRVYDINVDGVAHYGLYPGLGRGPAQARRPGDRRRPGARRRGLPADVGARRRALCAAPLPAAPRGRVWTWCTAGKRRAVMARCSRGRA